MTKARVWAGSLLLLSGVVAVIGASIDWVSVTPPPSPPPGVNFEDEPFAEEESSEPFTGLEAGDGWFVVAGAGALLVAGIMLVSQRGGGWLGFFATIPIGAIAIAAYRALSSPTSSLLERTETVGDVDPAAGLVLTAFAALAGLIASVVGIAATPRSSSQN